MKRSIYSMLLVAIAALIISPAQAQSFFDDFETGTLDPAYILINADSLIPALADDSAWTESPWLVSTSSAFDGSAALSISWYQDAGGNDVGPADDWLILPKMELDSAATLKFDARSATSSGDFPDDYWVLINTGEPTKADFEANGVILLQIDDEEFDQFASQEIDLSSYAGDSVYIAFRNITNTDGYGLWLDNISVAGVTTAIDRENRIFRLALYPNPASQASSLEYQMAQPGEVEVLVRSLNGQTVLRQSESVAVAGRQSMTLDTSSLVPGIYLVNVIANDTVGAIRLVVTR